MGARVFREESMDLAADLCEKTCSRHSLDLEGVAPLRMPQLAGQAKQLLIPTSFSHASEDRLDIDRNAIGGLRFLVL